MDTKKTIKNLSIVLICLSAVALIGLNIYQHQQIKKASQGTIFETSASDEARDKTSGAFSSRSKSRSPGHALAPANNQSGTNEGDDLNYQLEAAEEELAMVNKQLSDEESKKAEQKKIQSELQKKYREDPSYKKSMKNSLEIQYGDLFKKLNLPPEKLDKFKDLLVEEMAAQQDIWLEMGADYNTLSKEQRDELNKRFEALNKKYESQKADLLGENDYEEYKEYSETLSERYNVTNFMESLGSGEKLTETQKEGLIEAMYEEAKTIRYESTDDDSESSSSRYDEESMAQMLKFQESIHEAYLNAAKGILSASQIEQLDAYFKKERDRYKVFMEMEALRNSTSGSQEDTEKKSE